MDTKVDLKYLIYKRYFKDILNKFAWGEFEYNFYKKVIFFLSS